MSTLKGTSHKKLKAAESNSGNLTDKTIRSKSNQSLSSLTDYVKLKAGDEQPIFVTANSKNSSGSVLANLNSRYVEASAAYLKQASNLISHVAMQISQELVAAYRTKLAEQKTLSGKRTSEKDLPYFEVVSNVDNSTRVQTNLNGETLLSNIQRLIEELFEKNDFWNKGATEIWSNLVGWAVEEIKLEIGEADLASLNPNDFNHRLNLFLFKQESTAVQHRLTFLEEFYSQTITRHIVEELDLPSYPITGLEILLGIETKTSKKTSSVTEAQLSQIDNIAAIPTGLPIVSSISAQLQSDLWQPDASGVAHFRYRSKNNLDNFLEHYITSPGDIEALPWEAAEQIINKFGFNTVKLQFIFAAYAMRQARPWESIFTLKASDIIEELGWNKNHSTIYQLSETKYLALRMHYLVYLSKLFGLKAKAKIKLMPVHQSAGCGKF